MNGLLLVNVGTPDKPEPPEVRRYLAEFLSDPRVLDINAAGRWLLLNGVILRTRPKVSAAAYRKIWTEEGSPLVVHGEALVRGMQDVLGADWMVALGMRYGNPSIESALVKFENAGINRIVLFPLYPQYSAAATGTSIEAVMKLVENRWNVPSVSVVPPFYDHESFVDAFADVGRPILDAEKPDHVLFSFHGLPERHMRKSDRTDSHCLQSDNCCASIGFANQNCYRAQCFRTAEMLVKRLGISQDDYTVCFQSRLGRTPWIRPYTDVILEELPKKGIRNVVVFCPAFVADCLETLEEISMRGQESFREAGGESLTLVPSLNSHPAWISGAVQIVRDTVSW